MIGSDCIEQILYNHGVREVFGYSGSMMLRMMDSIYQKGRIDFHHCFHEQGAAFAADGYARLTGKLGVVIVTSGPGAINALAGVADSYLDSVPFLCITGQDYSAHVQRDNGARMNGFQDLDIASIARPITKYSVQIKKQADIPYELEKAIDIALSGRKGPVLVDIPMDFQFLEMPAEVRNYTAQGGGVIPESEVSDIEKTAGKITKKLLKAERPVVLAGRGVRIAGAEDILETFIQQTGLPLVCTLNGLDISCDVYGFSGLFGKTYSNLAIKNSDLILAFGTRFGNRQVGKKIEEYTSADIIHVDIDPTELGRIFEYEVPLQYDIKPILLKLKESINSKNYRRPSKWNQILLEWKNELAGRDYVNNTMFTDPVRLVETVCNMANRGDIITADVGQNEMWTAQGFVTNKRLRFLCSSGYGSMGFSLPCAIGASCGNPEAAVYAFMGDGGFQMNMQELAFLTLHPANLKCIVFNNSTLGMMREVQKLYYDNRFYGNDEKDFICPDLKGLADTYKLPYFLIENDEDFDIIKEVKKCKMPCIVDCRVNRDSLEHGRADDKELMDRYSDKLEELYHD